MAGAIIDRFRLPQRRSGSKIRTDAERRTVIWGAMPGYGQFCSVARALEALGGRWTILIVRELLCGARRFNTIRRGIPRISRTMLSERLQALISMGVVSRRNGRSGPEYQLTASGEELAGLVSAFGVWGQRWLPRAAKDEDIDLEPLLLDMERRVRLEALPADPIVIRLEISGHRTQFMLLKAGEVSLCFQNPGFPEPLRVRSSLAVLVAWWRGDLTFLQARRQGLAVDGARSLAQAFPTWFERYAFADVAPAMRV